MNMIPDELEGFNDRIDEVEKHLVVFTSQWGVMETFHALLRIINTMAVLSEEEKKREERQLESICGELAELYMKLRDEP